jgi:hypothetical protein
VRFACDHSAFLAPVETLEITYLPTNWQAALGIQSHGLSRKHATKTRLGRLDFQEKVAPAPCIHFRIVGRR